MPYHIWGDEWFEKYGKDLHSALDIIYTETYKWSRCTVSCKEKYGTIRYEWVSPPLPSSWTYTRGKSFIYYKWVAIGKLALKRAVKKACKMYPHIKEEILDDFTF